MQLWTIPHEDINQSGNSGNKEIVTQLQKVWNESFHIQKNNNDKLMRKPSVHNPLNCQFSNYIS